IWSAQVCSQYDFSDPYCSQLLQSVSKYCSSSQRNDKLDRRVPSGPARGGGPVASKFIRSLLASAR
ncbi:MAG: hypothetical protein ABL931_23610, partial [Usitatibacteraceae bacterium]